VLLAGVKCQSCKYVGGKTEFINNNNRCPKCGSHVSGIGGTPVQSAKCPKCGNAWDKVYCSNCGHKKWGAIISYLLCGGGVTFFLIYNVLTRGNLFGGLDESLFGFWLTGAMLCFLGPGLLLLGIHLAMTRPQQYAKSSQKRQEGQKVNGENLSDILANSESNKPTDLPAVSRKNLALDQLGAYVTELPEVSDERIKNLLQQLQSPMAYIRESALNDISRTKTADSRIINAIEILAASDRVDTIQDIAKRTLNILKNENP
jgi:hypothetical protein